MLFCKKGVPTNFTRFTRKHAQKKIHTQIFSYEFCEVSHNISFKEPFGRVLLQKHSFSLLPHYHLSPFQKQHHTYFLAEYFFSLICSKNITELRLGTRMTSIFQTLRQKPIFNPVGHLLWNLFCENC